MHTGSSYCSQSDTALTFGLGPVQRVESIEVEWPSGQVDRTGPVVANQVAFVEEGRGLVSAKVLPAKGDAARAVSHDPRAARAILVIPRASGRVGARGNLRSFLLRRFRSPPGKAPMKAGPASAPSPP